MIVPLIQNATIDVAHWDCDEFGVFPQGARAKSAYISPESATDPALRSDWRYLFKKSRRCYPEQFWAEIVAYRIGCLMGLQVPPAFAAVDSSSGVCGALIEWFYEEGAQTFVWAGEFLQKFDPSFDRERGTTHSMQGNEALLRAFGKASLAGAFADDWRQWWVDALIFDALIGNTDRHQDNWGFLFSPKIPYITLAPLFDNGTSLGNERHVAQFSQWPDSRFVRYVAEGRHHVRWRTGLGIEERGHFEVVKLALERWPMSRNTARLRLTFTAEDMAQSIDDLAALDLPVPLSPERQAFMLNLLSRRHKILQEIVL